MTRFNIDYSRYEEIADKIDFAPETCSDGICCFLDLATAIRVGVNRIPHIGFVVKTVLEKANSLTDVLDSILLGTARFRACDHLEPKINIENDRLNLQFRCGIYTDDRPKLCVSHPRGYSCEYHFEKKRQEDNASRGAKTYHLYSFSKREFPHVEPFSIGEMKEFISKAEYFLIPVPLKKERELFTPYDLTCAKTDSICNARQL